MKGNERKRTFMLITIPVLILFFTFNTLPLIKGFIYSFTNFKGYGSYEWVGLRNYIDLFQDARVGKSYLFTFKFAIVATITMIAHETIASQLSLHHVYNLFNMINLPSSPQFFY